MGAFSDSLFVPVMVMACLGWVVPKLLSLVMPEGVWPLIAIGVLSAVILCTLSALMFLALYFAKNGMLTQFFAQGILANLVFFGRLGVSAAIVWAPIMILSVAGIPRNWVSKTW